MFDRNKFIDKSVDTPNICPKSYPHFQDFSTMTKINWEQVGKRLVQIREEHNIKNTRQMALSIKADPSYYNKAEEGTGTLSERYFNAIWEMYHINPQWLKYGQTPKILHKPADEDVSQKDNHIKKRQALKEAGEIKNGIQIYEAAPVQAGIRTVYHDEHQVPDYVLNIPQFRDCNYGTRASGDSMYPEVRNGDLIICKELPVDARIIFGDMYVVHTKDGIETIKYVNQFVDGTKDEQWVLLVPHNKAAGMGTPIPRKEIIKLFKVRAIFKAY